MTRYLYTMVTIAGLLAIVAMLMAIMAAMMIRPVGVATDREFIDLVVFHHRGHAILIKSWSGFGVASPANGKLPEEAFKTMHCKGVDPVPVTTVVEWVDRRLGTEHDQALDVRRLRDVTSGKVTFELSPENVWSVDFREARFR